MWEDVAYVALRGRVSGLTAKTRSFPLYHMSISMTIRLSVLLGLKSAKILKLFSRNHDRYRMTIAN